MSRSFFYPFTSCFNEFGNVIGLVTKFYQKRDLCVCVWEGGGGGCVSRIVLFESESERVSERAREHDILLK